MQQTTSLKNQSLTEILLRESINIPFGWKEEVYYDRETDEISFSSPMTQNSWTEAPNNIGTIDGIDLEDSFNWIAIIDDEWIEVEDDEYEEAPEEFKDKEDYERQLPSSRIVTRDEAIEMVIDQIEGDDSWYGDIKENVQILKNGEVNE